MAKSVRILFEPLAAQSDGVVLPYEIDVRLCEDVVRIMGHVAGKWTEPVKTHLLAVVPDTAEVTLVTPDVRMSLLVEE